MSEKKSLSGIDKLISTINNLVALALLVAYLIPFISPINAPKISSLSLLFPMLYIANVIFLIFWLIKGNKRLLLSLIVLLIGYGYLSKLYKFSDSNLNNSSSFSVMSYNVKMLNHYQWSKDDSIPNKIEHFVNNVKPNILGLQEYYDGNIISLKYPYTFIKTKKSTSKFGLAIYSDYPIINEGSLDFKDSANNVVFCDLKIEKDTVRVYNIHFESLRLNPDRENFGEENSNKLISRLANTFRKQALQAEVFEEHLNQWKGKTIILGDLNNTAFSWIYRQIKQERIDAFEQSGIGFGATYTYPFPLRIDYIFADNDFEVNSYKTFDILHSDHYPIYSELSLP